MRILKSSIIFSIGFILTLACEKSAFEEANTPSGIPLINIETENNAPITSKINFIQSKIKIQGGKNYKNFTGKCEIRGRGNSTWNLPKKPYKIKLEAEASLLGLAPEKDWVLLANYLDGSHMLNAVAMKIGQDLEMSFTNHIIPVVLYLNGKNQGLYMLTEQIEVKPNRVNVGNDGLLLVLDTNYDETWKFRSKTYNLPVNINYPELSNSNEIIPIKTQFENLESLIARSDFPNNNYLDYFDADAMANYYLVYLLTDNEEINWSKSTYIYKPANGKFTMGPIWDFDWAFSYEGRNSYYSNPNRPLFWNGTATGTKFFSRILEDQKIKTLIKQKWAAFRTNKYSQIDNFISTFSTQIEKGRTEDYGIWSRGNKDFSIEVANLKQWFDRRGLYIDNYLKSF